MKRVERTKDKVSRAYWMQAFFENGQVLFPAKHLQSRPEMWQAPEEELLLFPSADHDDLFDGLETMMQEAMNPGADFGFVFIDVDPEPRGPYPWANGSLPTTWANAWRRLGW